MPNVAPARGPMRMGPAGLELVRAFESCMKTVPGRPGFFKPYLDSAGVLTIGWGHTSHHLPRFTSQSVWSQAECDSALAGLRLACDF